MATKGLTSAQVIVLRDMQRPGSLMWLEGRFSQTRDALVRRGLIAYDANRGTYAATAAGDAAIARAEAA
jgi:hypothetical protein